MRTLLSIPFFIFVFSLITIPAVGQTDVVQDYSNLFEIPSIKTMEASTSHLYVLSETEGMAVFRVYQDSLRWLYTSSGMQRRGDRIEADIRFAYLFGDSKRLTVLEPTSVLGVYSSTLLPARPLGVSRLQNALFIALGEEGLGKLSLETPETVDTEAQIVANETIKRATVLDVVSSVVSNQLFVLTGEREIHVFNLEEEQLDYFSTVELDTELNRLFLDQEQIWGSNSEGEIFEVNANGIGRNIGVINGMATDIVYWKEHVFVRNDAGLVWFANNGRRLTLWKSEPAAGNFITKSEQTVWFSQFDRFSSLKEVSNQQRSSEATPNASFELKEIPNRTLTFPNPLLLALQLKEDVSSEDVTFSYRSGVDNAVIKNQGLFWQPTVNQVGFHRFTILATNASGEIDSTSFTVDIRTFNAPPRFSPVRGSTIVVDDPFSLTFNAIDPENPSSTLIRYLGVDLPEGASLNEQTGEFAWTPTARQVGERTFRIVATDEQGAASSIEVTYTVIELTRENN
jgi:hypothetical protein